MLIRLPYAVIYDVILAINDSSDISFDPYNDLINFLIIAVQSGILID